MKLVLFYEKPGCATNASQKAWLRRAGCMVIERDLLHHGMEATELLSYLEGRPVREWFNPNAPEIKNGQIDPDAFDGEGALRQLMTQPILIRRPLISIRGERSCGFDQPWIERLLGFSSPRERANTECSGSQEQCEAPRERG